MSKIEKESDNPEEINYRKLLIQTMLGLLSLTAVFIILGLVFKEQMEAFSKIFVDQYGAFAVYLGFFITAVCPIPLPDHALSVFAMIGGLNFWVNVGISTLGSIMGGVVAYYLGKLLKHTAIYAKLMKRYKTQSEHLINKYGAWGLAIATLTPIPDSPVSWVCGALDLSFKKFFWLYLVCRFIKITYFLWFIKLGLLAL